MYLDVLLPSVKFLVPPPFFQYIFSSVLCYFVVRVLYFHTFSASAIIAEYFLYIFFYIFFSLIYIYIYIYIEYSTHSTHAWYIFCSFILHFRTVLYILSNL